MVAPEGDSPCARVSVHPPLYQLKHGILVGNLHTCEHECAKTVENKRKYSESPQSILAYKTSKKTTILRRPCSQIWGATHSVLEPMLLPLTASSPLALCNWNTRQRRRCNTSGPMRNAFFRSYKLWLDLICVCT